LAVDAVSCELFSRQVSLRGFELVLHRPIESTALIRTYA